jgi:hypothetical protein
LGFCLLNGGVGAAVAEPTENEKKAIFDKEWEVLPEFEIRASLLPSEFLLFDVVNATSDNIDEASTKQKNDKDPAVIEC